MTPSEFVARLHNHYGPPEHASNTKALKADYEAALAGTKPSVLQAASDRLINTHQFRSWPTIGECRAAVDAAGFEAMNRSKLQARGYEPPPGYRKPTPEERARVQALVDGVRARLTGGVRA